MIFICKKKHTLSWVKIIWKFMIGFFYITILNCEFNHRFVFFMYFVLLLFLFLLVRFFNQIINSKTILSLESISSSGVCFFHFYFVNCLMFQKSQFLLYWFSFIIDLYAKKCVLARLLHTVLCAVLSVCYCAGCPGSLPPAGVCCPPLPLCPGALIGDLYNPP